MHDNSRPVTSNQTQLHEQLSRVVIRHLRTHHRKPVVPHNAAAYEILTDQLAARPRPLVLDSFCGTGHSTALLAQRHPEHLVVGIDKSAQRLARHVGNGSDDYLLLRADCEDIWLLLAQNNVAVDYHYMFYPNPWPKARHLQRRVHGHGSFPLLLQLAAHGLPGRLELRSNWQLYVEEFGWAMHLAGHPGAVRQISGETGISLFETKYSDSGQPLWQFTADCGQSPQTSPT